MRRMRNIHPGEVLEEEFMKPLDITAYRISKETDIPQTRLSEIIRGKRRVSADTALRLSRYFGNSAQFWLGLQSDYDLEEEKHAIAKQLDHIRLYSASGTKVVV